MNTEIKTQVRTSFSLSYWLFSFCEKVFNLKLQGVMIEEITDKVDKATDHLQVNVLPAA